MRSLLLARQNFLDIKGKGVLRNHLSLQVAEYGDLQLQMSYLQSAERLTVVVLKARNLKPLDESKNASK